MTFVGEEAFGAWVARDGAKQPYKMYIAHITDKAADVVREVDLGDESVMAPALADLGDKLAIAWMSGDDGAKGRVHLGTVAASAIMSGKDKLHLAEDVGTSDPGNHRDPEIATGGGRLYFVWSDFTTKKKEGVLMLREFGCP